MSDVTRVRQRWDMILRASLEDSLARWGRVVARHPRPVIVVMSLVALAFGPDGALLDHSHGPHAEDVDRDGLMDLIAHFRIEDTGIGFGAPHSRKLGRIPRIFPAVQAYGRREAFARDCAHRHLVSGFRDFLHLLGDGPTSSRAFAGFWQRGLSGSGPERANFGPMRRRGSRFSLLPI